MKKVLLLGVLCLVWVGSANAALELMSVGGTWLSATGGVAVDILTDVPYVPSPPGYGNNIDDQVRWGIPHLSNTEGIKSGLGFTGISPIAKAIQFSTPFEVGELRHFNNAMNLGTSATGAVLRIDLVIASNTESAAGVFDYHMDVNETENTTGDNDLDADIITFTHLSAPQQIWIDGNQYTLDLLGFGVGVSPKPGFISPENQTNAAKLFASLVLIDIPPTTVPAPGALLLCGIGVVITGWQRRRRSV